MTELERQLLASVERLEKDSREREEKLLSYLKEVEQHLNELAKDYASVAAYLRKSKRM